ncbi:hypothetical protein [Tolypothrix sp. FACHB-123]|uniref:hypothetical protein n=1 Tax=Tolypothrix sp. FACHB-123 TaxID=2692868 RepID=UPI001A7ED0EB|nr:hypothetical protein [Tolypothrix sp. FACHB-123]
MEKVSFNDLTLNIGGVATASSRIEVTGTGEVLAVVAGITAGQLTGANFISGFIEAPEPI